MQHNGRSYASVCQSGTAAVQPSQDTHSTWQQQNYNYNHDYWVTPSSQQLFSAPAEAPATQNTVPTAETWSREPELGSWSPVFHHDDGSFVTSQQQVPSSQAELFAEDGVSFPSDQQKISFQPSEQLEAQVEGTKNLC